MVGIILGFVLGCSRVDICYGVPPEGSSELIMDEIPWESGPEYEEANGWTGVVYTTQEEWDGFLSDNALETPSFEVDFATSDVLLYERVYNGCNFEVVFDGAYLFEGTRYVRTQPGEYDAHSCTVIENRHAILVLEKVADSELSICNPYEIKDE